MSPTPMRQFFITVFLQLIQLIAAAKYSSLPPRPNSLSMQPAANVDHVTLPYDVTVIAYQDIISDDKSANSSATSTLDVLLKNFVDQMHYFDVNGYHTITVTELYAYLTGNMVLPPRSVLLTFQGGHMGVWKYAYPLLREKQFHAAIFVSPETAKRNSGELYMTLNHLKVIDNEPFFEVYPTWMSNSFLSNDTINEQTLQYEMRSTRLFLEKALGGNRPYFSWPKGTYNRLSIEAANQVFNMSFALDAPPNRDLHRLHRIPRFTPRRHQTLPKFVSALEIQQANLEESMNEKHVDNCFDLDVEVQGQVLREAIESGFVPCSAILFHANRFVTFKQLTSLCVNIKKGLGLNGRDLEVHTEVTASGMVTRAGVVVYLYECAKETWFDFTNELPKVEIMNPFSDIDGSTYSGMVVAMAGLCDVAAPPNDRGDQFFPEDFSSRGNAVVAAWRLLGCLRHLISPNENFPNDFHGDENVWRWTPSDAYPKERMVSETVASSATSCLCHFNFLIITICAYFNI